MAYEAHKWKIGEEITSEKLNHIEKGIEEAGLPREITDPQDGQTLKYDAASGKWVNGEGGSGGGTLQVNIVYDTQLQLDKTWQEIADAFPDVVVKDANPTDESQYFLNSIIAMSSTSNVYSIYIMSSDAKDVYIANSPQDFPTLNSMG